MRLREDFARADLAGAGPSLVFERADAEGGARSPVGEICFDEEFETSTAFALRDMDEGMHEQLAVLPGIGADGDSVTERDGAGGFGNDLSAAGRRGQLFTIRQEDAIDDQNPDAFDILDAGASGIGMLGRAEGVAVFEDQGLLRPHPFQSERYEVLKFFLIDHWGLLLVLAM